MTGRVLAIGLDGHESRISHRMIQAGKLPNIARLNESSAVFELDHGAAKRTGLAWEHFASGLAPQGAGRFSAVDFNRHSYNIRQHGARFEPFTEKLPCETVVFDAPYFDLNRCASAKGVVNWGAHDPGVDQLSVPGSLVDEMLASYGPYPAKRWIYGFVWPSEENTRNMGLDLVRAVDTRLDIARWLFQKRLAHWKLAVVVVSELHSAIEALWHGVDESHPLSDASSTGAAGEAVEAVYRSVDRLIGELMAEFPDDHVVVFSMHGMGRNNSDVPTMLLLPELLYRWQFGHARFKSARRWNPANGAERYLDTDDSWSRAIRQHFGRAVPPRWLCKRLLRALRARHNPIQHGRDPGSARSRSPGWMPAYWYRRYWPEMDAFALPSFYDGRVRINLRERERYGTVPLAGYRRTCDAVSALLLHSVDVVTGEPVVRDIEVHDQGDALDRHDTDCDLIIDWADDVTGFHHPRYGDIGPAPWRRTGGHTGGYGEAWITGPQITTGYRGVYSAFDLVPTIFDLLDAGTPEYLSGSSLLTCGESSVKPR